MNSFDLLIERYKKELIDAKRRSIEKEITVVSAEPEMEVEAKAEAEAEPVVSEGEEERETAFVFAPASSENEAMDYQEEMPREPLGLSNPLETLGERPAEANGSEPQPQEEEAEEKSFKSESESPDESGPAFGEEEPFPESLGALKVQVFMADRVYPISSAHVVITGKENGKVYFDGYTNTNGVVGSLYLPAPKKSLSQSPQEKPPYAQYDITVTHPRFQKRQYLGVPVFSGVESIQNIQLLPLGSDETDNADVTESEPNELLMKGGENNA